MPRNEHYVDTFHGKVLFKTPKYNDYFKENFRSFDVLDFIAEVTAHIPLKQKQYIRRYGLYSSRSRGKWEEEEHLCRLAPDGWKEKHEVQAESQEVAMKEEKILQHLVKIGRAPPNFDTTSLN